MTTGSKQRQVLLLISAALAVATLVAYEPIRHNDFIQYDDQPYVTENPNVKGGITQQSVIWAFTKSHAANWHPITWLSHMLDCEIYGLNPLGHHITSLLIHIANSLLLFLLLSKMTGSVWPSAFVAAAFALHPVHVESVAWVAERKDVLSGLFWMLTMLAYVHYVRRPNVRRYVLVLLAFVMGLMSKPMVVTLPFVLLLLDYWPLGRLVWQPHGSTINTQKQQSVSAIYQKASIYHLLAEKVPMLVLSAISSVITFVVQKQGIEVVASLKYWPLYMRVINTLGNYSNYIAKMLYPKGLAVLYPLPEKMTIDAAVLAVMGVTVLLVLWRRGRPWLVVGLLWYLGTLVPVIGLVQVGLQIMADRYTYLPSIGIFLIIAWGAQEIFSKMRYSKAILASGAAAALIAMVLMTRIQVGYWQDSPTLFGRTIAVTENNFIIHNNYGVHLFLQRQYDEAIRYFKEATRICPAFLPARQNLCQTLLEQGKLDEAITCLTKALQERDDWPEMHKMYNGLGWAYEQKGNLTLAKINYRKALSIKPDYELARNNLASVLAKQSKSPQPGPL
jgi:tetratricopeptide (TPR) repeat protein